MKLHHVTIAVCSIICCLGIFVRADERNDASSQRAATEVVIRLREKTTCASQLVRLGDCADVLANDDELQQRLERLTLFPAPPPGRTVGVDYDWIRARLNAHGVNLSRVEFTGSLLVTVAGPDAELTSRPQRVAKRPIIQLVKHEPVERAVTARDRERAQRHVAELIRSELTGHDTAWNSAEVVATVHNEDVAAVNAAMRSTWRVHSTSAADPTGSGYTQIWTLSFSDREGIEQRIAVTVDINPAPQILTLKRDISAGHVLQSDDLEYTTASRRDGEVVNWEDVIGKETVRPLRASMPITPRDVRRPLLVRHNDIVRVAVNTRGIRVSKEFKANGQGGLGEMIPLTSLDGRQKIAARVTGLHEAEIEVETAVLESVVESRVASPRHRRRMSPPNDATASGVQQAVSFDDIEVDGLELFAPPEPMDAEDGEHRFLPPRRSQQRPAEFRPTSVEHK